MLPCYVVLDLETTGGNASQDRITEIAAVRMEDGQEVARWSTLVHPGVPIPPFIQSLTGITDAMVADAPDFAEVAPELIRILDGAVLVAHNVRFDHGFVQNELARLDMALKTKTLCTVRLSRKLYPQHKGHGLDALLLRHGLHTETRHRAMGDVEVVLAWLRVATAELGLDQVRHEAQVLLQGGTSLPPHLETSISDIPETVGVYLFYGEGTRPLYVGRGVHLRTRVMSHFQSANKVAREMRLLQGVRRVEWRETAGELGAQLLKSRLVKELQPVYNRKLRRHEMPALPSWPYSGPVAIREHDATSGRTDIHVFDRWCHLATVQDPAALDEALQARQSLVFDLDTYRILLKRLTQPAGRDPSVFSLNRTELTPDAWVDQPN
ncbi:MAG TPA: exonuclease domain-containing protein [Rhodoferax sp.]|nr:exonuclease domain-containing protein [Rhodoferax sp.]